MNTKDIIYNIIGACMDVHNELKHGFQEAVYQEALMYEFQDRGISFQREVHIPIRYKQHVLEKYYIMDFVCENDIILELKATETLTTEHRYQLFTYLRLTKKPYGVLINFGENKLHVERYHFDVESGKIEGLAK